jgi:hypothetical protein
LRTIAFHAAATDPDMRAIRESIDGPPNFEVIAPADFAAPALPGDFDYSDGVSAVLKAARLSSGADAPLRYLELRVIDGRPIGLVLAGDRSLRFDPATGAFLPSPALPPHTGPAPSMHNTIKNWHRLHAFGDGVLWLNALVGIGLFVMIVTGLVMYFQLLRAASRAGRKGLFWFSGGWWRSLHRWVSVIAALFLIVVSVTGTLLSIDSLSLFIYRYVEPPEKLVRGLFPIGMTIDESSPLPDAGVPAMLNTTLAAYRAAHGDAPIKVLRLRYFAGMPQGVLVTGGSEPRQVVYNAATGQRVSMTEPGYPYTGFPFGWEEHELVKRIHRGDVFGIPGRLMDVFAGLSLVFLSLSGLIMYYRLWNSRRRIGRKQIFWA